MVRRCRAIRGPAKDRLFYFLEAGRRAASRSRSSHNSKQTNRRPRGSPLRWGVRAATPAPGRLMSSVMASFISRRVLRRAAGGQLAGLRKRTRLIRRAAWSAPANQHPVAIRGNTHQPNPPTLVRLPFLLHNLLRLLLSPLLLLAPFLPRDAVRAGLRGTMSRGDIVFNRLLQGSKVRRRHFFCCGSRGRS